MIIGLINGANVQHHALARYVGSASQEAAVKRVERFFREQEISIIMYAIFICHLLSMTGGFKLRLDRTNWEFGEKTINYLVLSWQIGPNMSVPLFFKELDKDGNSKTAERIDLLQLFIDTFGAQKIIELSADREFIGSEWIKFLAKMRIPFFIRVKGNMQVPWGKKSCAVKDFLRNWPKDTNRLVEKNMFGIPIYFACKNIHEDEPLIVMTNTKNLSAHRILLIYKQRWSIESFFKSMKTSGFNWENTHMMDPERLNKLLMIMGIATALIYLLAQKEKIPFRKTVDCPLRSRFRKGLQQFQYNLAQSLMDTIFLLMARLPTAPPQT